MNNHLKNALLSGAFASAALLAGCKSGQPKAVPPPEKFPTAAEVRQSARALYGTYNMDVVEDNVCSLSTPDNRVWDSCSFTLKKKQDDGFVYYTTYSPSQTNLDERGCNFAPDNTLAKQNALDVSDSFNRHMRAKFSELGFAVSGSFSEPENTLTVKDGDCQQYTVAEFVLRASDRIYTAKFGETYHFNGRRVESAVFELQPLDRMPITVKKQAAAVQQETASRDDSSDDAPAPRRHKEADSNICVGSCVGPHIDLKSGQMKLYSNGPGYKIK